MARLRLGVLISGRGSNLNALAEACAQEGFPAEIATVVANRRDIPGLGIAQRWNLPARTIEHRQFASREEFDAALDAHLRAQGVELVCLAGFDRLFSETFVTEWRDRLVNIHPSLLPSFKGLGLAVHRQAIEAGVRVSGCTVHFVRFATDTGPILAQAAVPVLSGDTPESLARRVLAAEHRLYPWAVRLIAEGRVHIEGERAILRGIPEDEALLVSPALPSGRGLP